MTRWFATARARLVLTSALVLLVVSGTAYCVPAGFGGGLLYLLPAVLLLLALTMRRFPGERSLLALIGRREPHRQRPNAASTAPRLRPRAALPRGGRLIASSLAVRPPPRSLVALS